MLSKHVSVYRSYASNSRAARRIIVAHVQQPILPVSDGPISKGEHATMKHMSTSQWQGQHDHENAGQSQQFQDTQQN
jgi:hypothetical protein